MKNVYLFAIITTVIGVILIVSLSQINFDLTNFSLYLASVDISIAISIIGLIYATYTINENTKARKMQAFNMLLDQWDKSKKYLNYVLNEFNYPDKNIKREYVRKVLDVCNRIAFMVQRKLISEKDVAEIIGGTMLRIWDILAKYIYEEERKQSSISRIHFEIFAEKTLRKYWKLKDGQYIYKGNINAISSKN